MDQQQRPTWTSKYAFILATIGSAVGLGNIWRFPYVMGQNGGAAFLIIYIAIIATICFVPLMVEIYFGNISKKECVGAYEAVNPKFSLLGWSNPLTGVLIASFYFVVGGWIINYIIKSFSQTGDYSQYFSNFVGNPILPCVCTMIFLLICMYYTARGVKKGIEFANKIMMPLFAILLICLIIVSLSLPNSYLGLEYMFKPDFSKINAQTCFAALGQAFFTLSVGMGVLLTYGSYIKEDKSIAKSAYTIILSDTAFALLAGVMIFPAVFSFGLEPSSGPGLVFITLPYVFSQIPYGNFIACAFFVLLLCAAVTSGISMLEVPVATIIEKLHVSRLKACGILLVLVTLLAIPSTLSFGMLSDFKIFDKTVFDLLDFLTSNILLPLNSLILCLIVGWYIKIKGENFIKNKPFAVIFNIGLRYVVPLVLIFLFYMGLK